MPLTQALKLEALEVHYANACPPSRARSAAGLSRSVLNTVRSVTYGFPALLVGPQLQWFGKSHRVAAALRRSRELSRVRRAHIPSRGRIAGARSVTGPSIGSLRIERDVMAFSRSVEHAVFDQSPQHGSAYGRVDLPQSAGLRQRQPKPRHLVVFTAHTTDERFRVHGSLQLVV